MADETRLNIELSANDLASSSIKQLQGTLTGLENLLRAIGNTAQVTSHITVSAVEAQIAAVQREIRARGDQKKSIEAVTTAYERMRAEAVSSAALVGRSFEDIGRIAEQATVSVRGLQESINLGGGVGFDREILSASASASTLATSLSAAAAADSYLRDQALATAAALQLQNEQAIAFRVNAMKSEDVFASRMGRGKSFGDEPRPEAQVTRAGNWFMTQGGTQKTIDDIQKVKGEAISASDTVLAQQLRNEEEHARVTGDAAMERAMRERTFADITPGEVGAGRSAAAATEEVSRASGLLQREARHVVAVFDGLARHQTGQVMSSIGSAFRDAGLGVAGLATSMTGLIAVMGTVGILRHAQEMGKWAETAMAGAAATGMSVNAFTRLQGALELMGLKGNSADAQLRHLATSLSTAIMDPASKAAEAFHNFGISQEELEATGGNTEKALQLLAEHFNQVTDSGEKAANMSQLAGRGFEAIVPLVNKGKDGLKGFEDQAQATGKTLDEHTARAVREAGEAVDHLGATISAGGTDAFIKWAPTIKMVAEDLEALVKTISGLVDELGQMGSALQSVFNFFAQVPSTDAALAAAHEKIVTMSFGNRTVAGVLDPQGAAAEERLAAQQKEMSERVKGVTGQHPQMRDIPGMASKHIGSVTNLQAMHEAAAAAADEATKGATSTSQVRIQGLQAEIAVIKQTIDAGKLSAKEQASAQTELSNKTRELRSAELSAAHSAGVAQAAIARQNYQDFAAGEKLKISEAQGSITQVIAIYNEWLNAANNIYHQHASEVLKIEKEKIQAINTAKLSELKMEKTDDEKQARLVALNAQLQSIGAGTYKFQGQKGDTAEDDIARSQAYLAQAAQVQTVAQKQIAQFTQVAQTADAGSTTQKEAQASVMDILLQSKQQELELYKKAGDAAVAAANKVNEAFTKFFDSVGSAFEQFGTDIANSIIAPQTTIIHAGLTSIKIQENTVKTAFKSLFVSIAQDLAKTLQQALGKTIAQSISGGASNSISELLSKAMSKVFSSAASDAAGKALGSAASGAAGAASGVGGTATITTAISTGAASTVTGISTAIATAATTQATAATANTTLIVGAITTAAAEEDALLIGLNAKPSVLGTTYARGGIVSAAGGMVVGGVGGTQLALLHDREMVLPKHISEGLQGAITGGSLGRNTNNSASLNYSPTLNMARGRSGSGMSRAELGKMMALHSGAMLGEARNLMRSGWRP